MRNHMIVMSNESRGMVCCFDLSLSTNCQQEVAPGHLLDMSLMRHALYHLRSQSDS